MAGFVPESKKSKSEQTVAKRVHNQTIRLSHILVCHAPAVTIAGEYRSMSWHGRRWMEEHVHDLARLALHSVLRANRQAFAKAIQNGGSGADREGYISLLALGASPSWCWCGTRVRKGKRQMLRPSRACWWIASLSSDSGRGLYCFKRSR